MNGNEPSLTLKQIRRQGVMLIQLEGGDFVAPFSKKPCIWYEWVTRTSAEDKGFTYGQGRGREHTIFVKSGKEVLEVDPDRIMLYLPPSFDGPSDVGGEIKWVTEFCLQAGKTYHAFVEKFFYHLPPRRLLPFLRRRRTTELLALSDGPFRKDKPGHPLIITRRGMTG